ncbi:hypothetical protein D915_008435 [Fasciola hepatica]|uniref:Uncharacterized protein n=1 Tax=Fasciola hepatica TaxID=6192 RepID=A0A4E0R3B7_FASHE|nr:hypothetical protein D915_008435 [Fasciola hepatica]
MSGKLTLDELDRVKRCVLMSPVRLPIFMANKEKYITALRQIARLNGIPVSKSAPVKPKLRGTRPQSDSRCPPISAYGAQRSSSGSPMPARSKPSSHSLVSEQSGSEVDALGTRRKEMHTVAKSISTNPEKSQSDSQSFNRTTTTRKDTSKPSRKQTMDQPVSLASNTNDKLMPNCDSQIPHQTIRNKIVRALCTFDFPPSPFSNALIPDQDYPVPPEESSKTQAGRLSSHSRANSKADKTMANIQNNWNTLPEGVCGCRLFTHGNLRAAGEDPKPTDGSGSRATDKTKGRNDNNTDPSGIQDIPVPMILEVDLRHPLIGV